MILRALAERLYDEEDPVITELLRTELPSMISIPKDGSFSVPSIEQAVVIAKVAKDWSFIPHLQNFRTLVESRVPLQGASEFSINRRAWEQNVDGLLDAIDSTIAFLEREKARQGNIVKRRDLGMSGVGYVPDSVGRLRGLHSGLPGSASASESSRWDVIGHRRTGQAAPGAEMICGDIR